MRQSMKWLALAAACSVSGSVAAQSSLVTVWFDQKQSDVSDRLALLCADNEATVVEQDDRHVLCSRAVRGVGAAYLFGMGRGASAPMLLIRFTLLKDKTSTRVQAAQWVENQSALGQTRQHDLSDRKSATALEDKLIAAGGHNFPPDLDATGGSANP